MPRRVLACFLFLASFFSMKSQTPAPSGAAHRDSPPLSVVVTKGKDGPPVPGLNQSDFTVLDNGAPQTIQSFRAVSAAQGAAKMIMVIDAVNVDYQRLAYERGEIDRFLLAQDGHMPVPTSLAIVSDTGTQVQPGFSTDGKALSQSLQQQVIGLRELRRSSGFYGAEERLQISLRALQGLLTQAQSIPGHKIIVWVSPGWPLLSGPAVELSSRQQNGIFDQVVSLSTQMRQANVMLYSVDPLGAGESPGRAFYYESFLKGVRKPSEVLPGNLGLQVLAVQSGGLALTGSNDIRAMLQRAADDTKAYYELTYTLPPADAPRQFHRIEIRTAEHLNARTRNGYYSQP